MPNPISVEPWYARSDDQVFHNDTRCAVGLRIPLMERLAGDGRRRLCPECKRLRDQPTLETQDVHSVTRLADRERLQNRILGADAGVDRGASAA
jgi:hypothetical protein